MKVSFKGGRTVAIAENEQDVRALLAFKDGKADGRIPAPMPLVKCPKCEKMVKRNGLRLHMFHKHKA